MYQHAANVNMCVLPRVFLQIYHTFYDEVRHYKTHWWKCDGKCQNQPPYHGMVKRARNRAPGPNDLCEFSVIWAGFVAFDVKKFENRRSFLN